LLILNTVQLLFVMYITTNIKCRRFGIYLTYNNHIIDDELAKINWVNDNTNTTNIESTIFMLY